MLRLAAGVRLDVGVLGAEELLGPVDGQLLDLVDDLAAAVVALAGIALGVLVGEAAEPSASSTARETKFSRGDQLEPLGLPVRFLHREQPTMAGSDVGERGDRGGVSAMVWGSSE